MAQGFNEARTSLKPCLFPQLITSLLVFKMWFQHLSSRILDTAATWMVYFTVTRSSHEPLINSLYAEVTSFVYTPYKSALTLSFSVGHIRILSTISTEVEDQCNFMWTLEALTELRKATRLDVQWLARWLSGLLRIVSSNSVYVLPSIVWEYRQFERWCVLVVANIVKRLIYNHNSDLVLKKTKWVRLIDLYFCQDCYKFIITLR